MQRARPRRDQKARSSASEIVTTAIEYIGADGDGIGTHPDGSRLYVPLSVPGDSLRVRVISRRGEGWAGEIDAILEPGPARRTPPCRHFGVCGGCTSQHCDDTTYRDWKTGRLAAALRRAGFEEPAVAPLVPGEPGTRRRMDLAVRRLAGGVTIGLHKLRGSEVVDLSECHVLHPSLFALVAPLRPVLSTLAALRRQGSVVVNLLDSGPDLLLRTDGELSASDRSTLTSFARDRGLPRISWAQEAAEPEAVCLLNPPVTSLSGVSVTPPPGAFMQATREAEAAIIAAVLDGLPAKRSARAKALELFAGCGTISFALASHLRVLAIEGDDGLVTACRRALNQAGLGGRIEVRRRDLTRQPFLANELTEFAAVILDPPHAGAQSQMPHIAAAKIPTVIYVSCDPFSLGRDAAVLRAAGYRLEKATPIDQFLWSARLEAVAVFRYGR